MEAPKADCIPKLTSLFSTHLSRLGGHLGPPWRRLGDHPGPSWPSWTTSRANWRKQRHDGCVLRSCPGGRRDGPKPQG
eukprot:4555901-Pyramimonas_sp.AAC.1